MSQKVNTYLSDGHKTHAKHKLIPTMSEWFGCEGVGVQKVNTYLRLK